MNIWIVTIGEPIPIGSGTQDRLLRSGSFAIFLADHGHEVTWWTSTFDHFHKKHYFETDASIVPKDNLRIQLIHGCGYKRNVSLRRFHDHYSVAKVFAKLIQLEKRKPDIILTSFPTESLCLESVRYGLRFQIPVVLDMRDMWPDILVDTFPRGLRTIVRFALSPVFRKAQRACEEATAITGITDAFIEWGLKKANRAKSVMDKSFPLSYSSTLPPENDLRQAEKYWDNKGVPGKNESFNVCFFGTLGWQLDIDTVILAARKIRGEGIPINFILCGSGDRFEYYKKMAWQDSNIILPGHVDAARIYALMQRSFIGLDPLPDRYDFLATINNKAIEYLSAGLPIISSPDKGVLFQLLEKNQCGISYPAGDSDSLAAHLLILYNNRGLLQTMSDKAVMIFREKFTAEHVNADMMRYLEEIISIYGKKSV